MERLGRLQLATQVSEQQLASVDGLALGQGVAQGAESAQMPQGGWVRAAGRGGRGWIRPSLKQRPPVQRQGALLFDKRKPNRC